MCGTAGTIEKEPASERQLLTVMSMVMSDR